MPGVGGRRTRGNPGALTLDCHAAGRAPAPGTPSPSRYGSVRIGTSGARSARAIGNSRTAPEP